MAAEDSNADPLIGKLIAGKFLVARSLGQGAMGKVYLAEQTNLSKQIALKVLRSSLTGDPQLEKRFHREARAASALSHPNIVQTVDFGDHDGVLYIAMELLTGRDLRRIIRDEWPFAPERIARIVGQILGALDEAHAKGVVHRDLKPENVMIIDVRGESDFVKVCDFGIAKVMSERDSEGSAITSAGMVCGTPEYMSPEQARGDPLDGRSDLYAASVILYHMVAGELPFRAESALGVVTKHLTETPVAPSKRRPGLQVLPALEALILRGLEKNREQRFASASEMKLALYDAVGLPRPVVSSGSRRRRDGDALAMAETGTTTSAEDESPEWDDQTASSPAVSAPGNAAKSESPAQGASSGQSQPPAQNNSPAQSGPSSQNGSAAQSASGSSIGSAARSGSRSAWVAGVLLAGFGIAAGGYLVFERRAPRPPAPTPELVLAANEPRTAPAPGAAAATAPEAKIAAPEVAPPEAKIAAPEVAPPEPGDRHAHHAPAHRKEMHTAASRIASAPRLATTAPVPAAPVPAAAPARSPFAEGEALLKGGDLEGALAKYQEAARQDPGNARAQRQIGKCYTRLGQRDRALPYFKRYLELAPDASDAPFIQAVLDGK